MRAHRRIPRGAVTLLGVALVASAGCGGPDEWTAQRAPAEVAIDVSGLARFAEAVEGLDAANPDCSRLEAAAPVSPLGEPGDLCDAVRERSGFYRALPAAFDAIRDEAEGLPEIMERWRVLHPGAPLPDIHLVVGPLGEEAALREEGVFVAAEWLAGGLAGPARLRSPEELGAVVARELVRVAQRRPRFLPIPIPGLSVRETPLARAVLDGTVDFVATMVAGRRPEARLHDWARSREAELWEAFRPVREQPGAAPWGGTAPWADAAPGTDAAPGPDAAPRPEVEDDSAPPGDPARYLGYRIAESYWARSTDRPQALRALLSVDDFPDFLEESGYDGSEVGGSLPPSLRGFGLGTWPGFDCSEVAVGASRLFTCTAGEDVPAVVLDAGPDADHRGWHELAPALASGAGARLVVFDHAGSGRSAAAPGPRGHARLAHELAGLLEVVAGRGPYVAVGPAGAGHLDAFAELYPWRIGARIALDPVGGSGSGTAGPTGVQRVLDAAAGLEAAAALDPPAGGAEPSPIAGAEPPPTAEPAGCWSVEGSGGSPAEPIRLALVPSAGRPRAEAEAGGQGRAGAGGQGRAGAERPTEAGHPVLPAGSGAPLGRWIPRGRDRIELRVGEGADAWAAVLAHAGDGSWRWAGPSVLAAATNRVTLRAAPCELPD